MTRLQGAVAAFRSMGVVFLIERHTGEWGAVSAAQYTRLSATFLADYHVRLDIMSAAELSDAIKRRN